MRFLLLVLLIATFPLRGFASTGMQTSMGLMSLHQASISVNMASTQAMADASALQSGHEPAQATAAHACCTQCESCELCHLLLQQAPAPALLGLATAPPSPASSAFAFASADVHRAHKPPLGLI